MKSEDQVSESVFFPLDYGVTHRSVLQMRAVEPTPKVAGDDSNRPLKLGVEASKSEKELV